MKKLITILVLVLFATNAYAASTLVYDPGSGSGPPYDTSVAMDIILGAGNWDLRNAANPVTAADLATHDLLVVGWNEYGDMTGLTPADLESGITGNILLTGHDADYHTRYGPPAAETFLTQAMDFAKAGGGTGLVALSDPITTYSYLPASWGVTATWISGETVTAFTAEGLASGVYDGLTTADMSGWGVSFHDMFTAGFTPFELGLYGGEDVVITVGYVIPAPGAILLGSIGVALVGWLRRRRTL